MSIGDQLEQQIQKMVPGSEASVCLQENNDIRRLLAGALLEGGASASSDPKIMNVALKALKDVDSSILTQQRNQIEQESSESANAMAFQIYKELVTTNGKRCVREEDEEDVEVLPVSERTDVELNPEEFELNPDEAIIGIDTTEAMLSLSEEE